MDNLLKKLNYNNNIFKVYYIYKSKMTHIPDYYNCNFGDFTKLVQAISGSKETEYEKMIEQLNTKYIELSTEIMRLNEKRLEHLNKIKYAQTEYRKLLGEGEITVSVDIDDNSDNEEKIIVETKPGVRGRKKKEKVETVETVLVEDTLEDLDDVLPEVKKSTKKTVSKKSVLEEVEEPVKPIKTSKKSNKELVDIVDEEVEEPVKPTKTSKKLNKDVVEAPVEEEVKTKKSTKGPKSKK